MLPFTLCRLGRLMVEWKERIEDILSMIGTVPPPILDDYTWASTEDLDNDDDDGDGQEEGGDQRKKVKVEGEGDQRERKRSREEKVEGGARVEVKVEGEGDQRERKRSREEKVEGGERVESAEDRSDRKDGKMKTKRRKSPRDREQDSSEDTESVKVKKKGLLALAEEEDLSQMPLEAVFIEVEKWSSGLAYAIDSQDAKWTQQVDQNRQSSLNTDTFVTSHF